MPTIAAELKFLVITRIRTACSTAGPMTIAKLLILPRSLIPILQISEDVMIMIADLRRLDTDRPDIEPSFGSVCCAAERNDQEQQQGGKSVDKQLEPPEKGYREDGDKEHQAGSENAEDQLSLQVIGGIAVFQRRLIGACGI